MTSDRHKHPSGAINGRIEKISGSVQYFLQRQGKVQYQTSPRCDKPGAYLQLIFIILTNCSSSYSSAILTTPRFNHIASWPLLPWHSLSIPKRSLARLYAMSKASLPASRIGQVTRQQQLIPITLRDRLAYLLWSANLGGPVNRK